MRWVPLVLGLVLVFAGGLLWVFPVYMDIQSTSPTVPAGESEGWVFSSNPPLAVFTSSIPFSAGWTSPQSINVTLLDCGTSQAGCSSHPRAIDSGSGFSGGFAWTGLKGEYYELVVSGAAQVGASYGIPLYGGLPGAALTGLGAVLVLYGAFTGPVRGGATRPRAPPRPPAAGAAPTTAVARPSPKPAGPAAPARPPPPPTGSA